MKLETAGKARNRRISIVIEVLLALMLGCACFYVFVSMFGLKWSQNSMFSGGVSQGFAGIWDKVADKLGSVDYIMLPKFKAELKDSGEPVYGLALTLILAAFTVISYMIIKARSRALLLLFAVPFGIAMLFYGLTPSAYAGGAFACAIIIALAVMTMPEELTPKYFIVPVIMLLVGAGALAAVEQTITLREPRTLSRYGASVKRTVGELRYGSDPLPEGDLSRLDGSKLTKTRGNIKTVKELLGQTGSSNMGFSYDGEDDSDEVWDPFGTSDDSETSDTDTSDEQQASEDAGAKSSVGGKTALEVNMSSPDSYYLRGFVGAKFDKNKWSALDNDTFYDMRDTVFWLNRRDFDGLSEMSRAAELGGTSGSFGMMPGDGAEDTLSSDSVLGTAGSTDTDEGNKIEIKVKSASRRHAFTPYELKLSPASGDKLRASEMVLPKGTRNYGGSHLGNNGLFGQSSYKYNAAGNITGSWTNAVGKLYTAPQSEDLQSYFISESHYNVLQYENYKKVPDKYKELFSTEIGSPGDISSEHAEYKETISLISGYLSSRYLYSESFKKPGKRDSIEAFIEKKSGCDVHFASLATLLFRYYGIPARYVEGYLITPHMLEDAGDDPAKSTVSVPKAASHAWTEIYIDGFGWVPFEATPEYRGVMDEADLSIGLQNVDYEYTPPEDDDEEEDDDVEEEDEEVTRARKKVVRVMRILLLLLLLAVLVFVLRKVLKKVRAEMKWRQAFKDKDPKTAVRALYQYSVNHGWKLSDRAESLGLAAGYSQAAIHESDRAMMQAEFNSAKTRYKQERAKEKAAAKEARAKEKAAAKEARAKEKAAVKEARAQEKAAAQEERARQKAEAKAEAEKKKEEKKAETKETGK